MSDVNSSDVRRMAAVGDCATWLAIVSQLYTNRMNRMLENHDLTLAQFSILHHVAQPHFASGTRISDIASAVEVGQPAVTKGVAKFEAAKLVKVLSMQDDKRSKRVCATAKGRAVVQDIRLAMRPNLQQLFNEFTLVELEGLSSLIRKLGSTLDIQRNM